MRFTLDDAPFAGRTGHGVTIAVLDSGIHPSHPHVGVVDGGTSLIGDATDWVDHLGHGTAVAAAIREKSPASRLLAVKLFHDRLATNVDSLARGVEWAADHGAQVINLSLGTRNETHLDRIGDAIAYAAERGAIIVSAMGDADAPWFPGSLPGVIGVAMSDLLDRGEIELVARDDALPRVVASPYPRPIPNVPRERNVSGVSFAVANTTGFVARAIEAGEGKLTADVLRALATPV